MSGDFTYAGLRDGVSIKQGYLSIYYCDVTVIRVAIVWYLGSLLIFVFSLEDKN